MERAPTLRLNHSGLKSAFADLSAVLTVGPKDDATAFRATRSDGTLLVILLTILSPVISKHSTIHVLARNTQLKIS